MTQLYASPSSLTPPVFRTGSDHGAFVVVATAAAIAAQARGV